MARRDAFYVVRRRGLHCGQARSPPLWSGARSFSVRPGARTFFVARREDLLVARCVYFLCGQARGLSVWSGTNELAWGWWPLYRRFVSRETGLRPVMVIYGRFVTGRTGLRPAGFEDCIQALCVQRKTGYIKKVLSTQISHF